MDTGRNAIQLKKMKILLVIIFSASLAGFIQTKDTTGEAVNHRTPDTPDTVRALILVTMCRRCAAEPMPGYVVVEAGKRPVYLDCRKRALKYPQVGWHFREVDVNVKLK